MSRESLGILGQQPTPTMAGRGRSRLDGFLPLSASRRIAETDLGPDMSKAEIAFMFEILPRPDFIDNSTAKGQEASKDCGVRDPSGAPEMFPWHDGETVLLSLADGYPTDSCSRATLARLPSPLSDVAFPQRKSRSRLLHNFPMSGNLIERLNPIRSA